jgi:hypothetical protein
MFCQSWRLPAVAVLALAATATAGCSSSGGGAKLSKSDPLATVAQAMKDQSGHIEGSLSTKGRADQPLTGEWKGSLNGEMRATATFTSANGTLLPSEIRTVDNMLYYKRAVASLKNEPTLGIFARQVEFKPWRSTPMRGIIMTVPAAFSPASVVEWLQRLHTPLKVSAGARVGSVATSKITTTRPVGIGLWVGATVELSVDHDARVVQVAITAPGGGARYLVSNYGATVSVKPPPKGDVSTVSELPVLKPDGAFATMKSGTTNGVQWALQQAPGTEGSVCWRWQATPPLPEAGLKQPGTPRCFKPAGKDADPEDMVAFVVDGNGTGKYDALAAWLPAGAKDVKIGFVGGKVESLPAGTLVVWVGPNKPVKGYLGVTLADGTKLDCGAGAIATPADLGDPRVTENVAEAPWGCLQHVA